MRCICPLREQALANPQAMALVCQDKAFNFKELDLCVEACREVLKVQGLRSGNRLGLVSHNAPEMVILLLACWREGIVVCPLNPRFSDQRLGELIRQLDLHSCWFEKTERNYQLEIAGFVWRAVSPAGILSTPLQPLYIACENISTLLLTSGSSGHAKAVALTIDNFLASAQCSTAVLQLETGDGWLLSLPLFHVGGMSIIFRCLLAGATIVLPGTQPVADVLSASHVTHLSLVNTQLYRLLEAGMDWSATAARVLLLGGAAVTPELVTRCRASGLRVLTSYGMTESTALVCCGEPVNDGNTLTSGVIIPGREVMLANNGEILLRGQGVFSGYWNDGILDPARDSNSWFHSRDKGRWVDGQLLIEGRLDNMMISGGENIQPEEIERILLSHADVAEALVVPVPHDEYGQRPVAYICRSNDDLTTDVLIELLTATLARFKVPDVFILWPESLAAEGLKVNRKYYQQRALSLCSSTALIDPDGFVRLNRE